MRGWLVVVLVGCSTSAEPGRGASPGVGSAAPAARVAAPEPAPTGGHGAEITALAITSAGDAAASIDRLGGIRLWPSLDGVREPVVIRGTAKAAVALARDAAGFSLALTDAAGHLELVRTSADGSVRARQPIRGDATVVSATATPTGFLVLFADQQLHLVGADGRTIGELAPDPGSHVASVVVGKAAAVAVVVDGKQARARRLVLDGGLAWGTPSPPIAGAIERAVLSPDGARLAISRPGKIHPELIDLATGKAAGLVCVTEQWPNGETAPTREEIEGVISAGNTPVPLGFVSPDQLACTVNRALLWWSLSADPWGRATNGAAFSSPLTAVGDHRLIGAIGASLLVATPQTSRYLGYGIGDVQRIAPAGDGLVAVNGAPEAVLLDRALRERAAVLLPRNARGDLNLVMLDERYAVITDATERGDAAVLDAVTGARRQSLDMRASDDRFVYEPAQRVLSTAATGEVRIARWDPQTQTFAPPTVVEATGDTRIVPIDPARSGGIAAIVVERRADDDTRVGELSAAELAPAASVRPRTTYAVHGEVRAIDRTGRLYVHDPAHANDLAIYEHGKPGARLVGVGARQLRPSPDGARVAVIGDGAIAVLDRAGVERWTAPVRDGDTVAWLGGGELAIAYPTGIEVRAADTGAVTARRCGWAFGLHDQPPALHTRGNDLGSLCDRPPARR